MQTTFFVARLDLNFALRRLTGKWTQLAVYNSAVGSDEHRICETTSADAFVICLSGFTRRLHCYAFDSAECKVKPLCKLAIDGQLYASHYALDEKIFTIVVRGGRFAAAAAASTFLCSFDLKTRIKSEIKIENFETVCKRERI